MRRHPDGRTGVLERHKLKITNYSDIQSNILGIPGAKDVSVRLLAGPQDGASNSIMMMLEIAPGGNTPDHHHAWEEAIFIKSGAGEVKTSEGIKQIREGTTLFFMPDEPHQFVNTGAAPLEALCVIPVRK